MKRINHGFSRTRLYRIWIGIKYRCLCKSSPVYNLYGGRGITLCEDWKTFIPFKEWAESHGYNRSLTIDRIDNNSGYCPDNCRWTTMKEQGLNRNTTIYIEYKGERRCIKEWAEKLNIKRTTLEMRLTKYKWSIEKALTTPVVKGGLH